MTPLERLYKHPMDVAKEHIRNYYIREFSSEEDEYPEPDFSDLSNVSLLYSHAYSDNERDNEPHELKVYADLINSKIKFYTDNNDIPYYTADYGNLQTMCLNRLWTMSFDDLVAEGEYYI